MIGDYIIVFDVFAIIYYLILALAYHFSSHWPSKYSKYFRYLLIVGLVGSIADILIPLILEYSGTNKEILFRFTNSVYLFSINLFFIFIFRFILTNSKTIKKNKFIDCVHVYSIIVLIGLYIIGLFGNTIVILNNGDIKYGVIFILIEVFITVFILLILYVLIRAWKHMTRIKRIIYSFLLFISLITFFSFVFYPHVLIAELLMSIYTAFIFVAVYNEENYKEELGSIYTKSGFTKMIKLFFLNETKTDRYVFVLTLNEYNSREVSFGVERTKNFRAEVIRRLSEVFPHQIYSISKSKFVIICEKDVSYKLSKLFIENSFLIESSADKYIKIAPTILKFNIPSDFRTTNEVFYAINSSSKIDYYDTNRIINISRKLITDRQNNIKEETIVRTAVETNNINILYVPVMDFKHKIYHGVILSVFIGDLSDEVNFNDFSNISKGYGLRKNLEDESMLKLSLFIERTDIDELKIERVSITFGISEFNVKGRSLELIDIFRKNTNKAPKILSFQFIEDQSYINEDIVKENMNYLRSLGITCVLSDYGSGYSTLNYISKFPFDGIKINRRITSHVEEKSKVLMLEYLVNVSKDLHKTIMIDGVDEPEILEIIKSLDIDCISGRLFGDYMTENEIVKFFKEKIKTII